jgi:hypothetical protein
MSSFRHSDVVRAIKAARAAGESVAGIELDRDGKIKVLFGEKVKAAPSAEKSDADRVVSDWLHKRGLT